MSSNDNIKVAIKVRPLIKREKDARQSSQWRIQDDSIECLHLAHPNTKYAFDHICDEGTSTMDLFNNVAKPIVLSSVNGFNGTIFAYGQTSSGKTHTMLGNTDEPGIMVLATRVIFDEIKRRCNRSFIVRISYIEIYNERIFDLFDNRAELKIQESGNGDIRMNCREKLVNSEQEIIDWIQKGNKQRKVGETAMNQGSSRSHTIFSIIIESTEFQEENAENGEEAVHVSVLNLVDLAGSERADATGATGERLKEGAAINKSLLSLSVVISKLSEEGDQPKFINYRDSKLTRILQPSLGGNALTAIICTITPAAVDESNYTLGFAMRAKNIKNKPVLNEVLSDAVLSKRYKKQIAALEKQLFEERTKLDAREKEIQWRKERIIHSRSKTANNRRKTWAATNCMDEEIGKTGAAMNDTIAIGIDRPRVEPIHPRFETFGHQIEYSDEQFNNIMDASFGDFQLDAAAANGCSSLLTDRPNVRSCMNIDLLKTPTSLKPMRKSLLAERAQSPLFASEIDKDKRIRDLENELLELQQFIKLEKQTEIEIKLQSTIEENRQLNEKLHKNSDELAKLKELYDSVEPTCAKMKIECNEAVKAKDLAVAQCTSIEFEYEQYQVRAKNREAELVSRLDECNNEQRLNELKELVSTLQSQRKEMDTKLFASESESKILENEKKMLLERIEKMTKSHQSGIADLTDKNKKLENEYNSTSTQLVDSIQENEDLRAKCSQYDNIAAELKQAKDLAQAELQEAEKKFNGEKDELKICLAKSELLIKEKDSELDELKKLNASLSPLKVKHDILSIEIKESRHKIGEAEANCEAKLQAMRAELQSKSQQLDAISIEKEKLTEELAEQTQKATDSRFSRSAFDALAITSTKYIDDLKVAGSQLEYLQGKLVSTESEMEGLRNELQTLNNRLVSTTLATNNLAEFETTIAELQRQIKDLEDSNGLLTGNHNVALDTIQAENTLLQNQLSQMRSDYENLENSQDLSDQRESMHSLDAIVGEMQTENAKMTVALEEGKAREIMLEMMITDLKSQIEDQQKIAAAHSSEHSNVMNDILNKNIEKSNCMAELQVLHEQLLERTINLESTNAKHLDELQSKSAEISSKTDEIANLNDLKNKLSQDLKEASELIERLSQEINEANDLKEKLSQELDKANDLKDHISQERDEADGLKEKISQELNEANELKEKMNQDLNKANDLNEKLSQELDKANDLKDKINQERSEADGLKGEISQELNEANELKEKMRQELSRANELMEKISQELNESNGLREKMSQELNEVNVRNGELKITSNELQKKNEEFKKLIANYLQELSTLTDLQSQFKQQNEEMAQLQTTIDKLTKDLEISQGLNQKQVDEIDTLSELQTKINNYVEQIALLESNSVSTFTELQSQLKQRNEEIAQLKTTITKINNDLEISRGLNQKQIDEINDLSELLESNNENIQSQTEEQQAILQNNREEISKLTNELALLESKNAQLEANRSEAAILQNKIDAIKMEADECRNQFEQQVSDLKKQIAELLHENESLKKSEVQIKNTTNNVKQELENHLDQMAALELHKEQLQEENIQLSKRITAIKAERRQVEEKLQEKDKFISATEEKLITTVTSFESKIDLIKNEYETQINALKSSTSEKDIELKATKDGLAQSRAQLEEVHGKMDKLTKLNTETLAKNKECQKEIQRLMVLINQMDDLRNQIEVLRAENADLKSHEASITVSSVEKTVKVQLGKNSKRSSREGPNTSRDTHSSDLNNLLGENNLLKSKNEKLEKEVDDLRQTSRLDRKSKRQSLHDDSRRFDYPIEMGCQTEAASELCACSEHVKVIKKLRQDLAVRSAQLETLKDEYKSKYLQNEIASLEKEVSKLRGELNEKKAACEILADKLYDVKSKPCVDCAKRSDQQQIAQPIVNIKTERGVEVPEAKPMAYGSGIVDAVDFQTMQEKYKMAKDEYKKYKGRCDELQASNRELNGKLSGLQQTYQELLDKYKAMEQSHAHIVKKNTMTKAICNDRLKEMENFQNQISRLNGKSAEQIEIIQKMQKEFDEVQAASCGKTKELDKLREKYEMVKNVALHRDLEIKKMKKIIEDQDSKKENIPQDFNRNA